MSAADPESADDAYASDDYELESPARSQGPPGPSPVAPTQQQTFRFDTDALENDESDDGAVAPLPQTAKSKRARTPHESDTITGRHLMDNTPWTYTVSALQVRMLRIPVSESAAVRELRVFATIDKQAAQSRGSRWKQELQPAGGSPLRSTTRKKGTRRKPLPTGGRVDAYRRSGLIEEAKWVRGDGKLQWTFPMEKFRRLKAYAPRIKAFVYGIGDTVTENHSQAQMEHLARQEKDSAITSFGWFFLDLRTPDLPERWLKLQNSPFGGEVLISSTFSPGTISPGSPRPSKKRLPSSGRQEEDEAATSRAGKVPTTSTVVSGDNGEYLQIGDSDGQEIFVLSVFIQAALNLSKVVEAAVDENRGELERMGFWLSYSLFDVVVQTDVFYNLSVAEFSPIRDSFRVKSSLRDLKNCIENLACLTVFMCTENRVLAGVEIPLLPLLSKEFFSSSDGMNHELNMGDTSEIEGTFSFPGFDEAVVTASVAVEFVESEKSKLDTMQRPVEMDNTKQLSGVVSTSGDTTEQSTLGNISGLPTEKSANEQILFKLDYLRLKSVTLAPFAGSESILIEVAIGEEHSSGNLAFCAFTRHYAYATSQAVGVLLENISSQTAMDTPIRIRCLLSDSNQLVANSSLGSISIAQDDEGYPKSIVLQMMNESSQLVGQCRLICSRGSAARQMLGRELLDEASSEKHRYRMCLRLKSVRDIELPGGYCLRYQNPFLSSALLSSDWFTVIDKGEVETLGFYCILDVQKDPAQIKRDMQESVNVDLVSSDEDRVGTAVFSLSYLFFSEERFCCSEEECEEIFATEAEAEAHWLEVHTASALPNTDAGPEAYSHSYRSCSINIPIVCTGGDSGSRSRRVGSIRVSAYLEDMGLVGVNTEATMGSRFAVPTPTAVETETKTEAASPKSPLIGSPPERNLTAASSGLSAVRGAEEAKPHSSSTNQTPIAADHLLSTSEEEGVNRAREQQKEAAQLKETLERERSAWKQEQHLQQLQWKRRFAEMEKARMDELEEEWARREEERSNLLKTAQEEYQRLEQTLRKSLADLETRERRLTVAEAALQREQEAKRDENESLQRRLKSEQSHTLSLAKKQTEAYERRISLLETQLSDAERRAKQVETDFAEYRQQQRKLPESRLREEIAALKGSVAELEKQKMVKERECEVAEANVQKMKAQLEHVSSLLAQEKKQHEARVVDELEKLRVKYIAREEKYVLDGDRDELRAIKQQLDELKGFNLRSGNRKQNSSRYRSPSPQHRHSQQWHTQRRHTALARHTRSGNQQQYQDQPSSLLSDRASEDGSAWEVHSFVETNHGASAPLGVLRHELTSSRRSDHIDVSTMHGNASSDDGDFAASVLSYEGPPDSELGRLVRERELLLASGAYDAQSYLVRELDRLIKVTKANAEHQISMTQEP